MNKNQYRKLYEKHLGDKLPKDFHVHHIDHDRENNNISNLVAIPAKLHHQYHYLLNKVASNFYTTVNEFLNSTVAQYEKEILQTEKKYGALKKNAAMQFLNNRICDTELIDKMIRLTDKECFDIHIIRKKIEAKHKIKQIEDEIFSFKQSQQKVKTS